MKEEGALHLEDRQERGFTIQQGSRPTREEMELSARLVMVLSKTEVTGGAGHLPRCCTVA